MVKIACVIITVCLFVLYRLYGAWTENGIEKGISSFLNLEQGVHETCRIYA